MKSSHAPSLRVISTLVLAVFLCQEISQAAPADFSPSPLSQLSWFPANAGSIDEIHSGSGPRTIYLIQDAHTNDSGQVHISQILEAIGRNRSIGHVFVEGATGDVSLDALKPAPLASRERVGLSYLRKGQLQGSEYWNLTTGSDARLWGVEDPALYEEALRLYARVARARADSDRALEKVESTIAVLKKKTYSPDLLRLDEARQAHESGRMTFPEYARFLARAAKSAGVRVAGRGQFRALLRLSAREKRVDFAQAQKECAEALETLAPRAREEFQEALREGASAPAARFDGAETPQSAAQRLLEQQVEASDANTKNWPALRRYWKYLEEARRFDARAVLDEKSAIEGETFAALARTETERRLLDNAGKIRVLREILSLRASSSGFESYRRDPGAFSMRAIGGFLNRRLMDLGSHYEKTVFTEAGFDEAVRAAAEFYELTYRRDEAFVRNVLERLDASGETDAALVAGGYHSANLKKLFADLSVSYVVVTPLILHATDEGRYERLLLEEVPVSAPARVSAGPDGVAVRLLMAGARTDGPKRRTAEKLALDLGFSAGVLPVLDAPSSGARARSVEGDSDPMRRLDTLFEGVDIDELLNSPALTPATTLYTEVASAHRLLVIDRAGEKTTAQIADEAMDFRAAREITVIPGSQEKIFVRWRGGFRIYDVESGEILSEAVYPSYLTRLLGEIIQAGIAPAAAVWSAMPPGLRVFVRRALILLVMTGALGASAKLGLDRYAAYQNEVRAVAVQKAAAEEQARLTRAEAERQAKIEAGRIAAVKAKEESEKALLAAAEKQTAELRAAAADRQTLNDRYQKLKAESLAARQKYSDMAGNLMVYEEGGKKAPGRIDNVRLAGNLEPSERQILNAQLGDVADEDFVYRDTGQGEIRFSRIAHFGVREVKDIDLGAVYQIVSRRLSTARDRATRVNLIALVERIFKKEEGGWTQSDIAGFFDHGLIEEDGKRRPVTEEQGDGRWTYIDDTHMGLRYEGQSYQVMPGIRSSERFWQQEKASFVPTPAEKKAAEEFISNFSTRIDRERAEAQETAANADAEMSRLMIQLAALDPEAAAQSADLERERAERMKRYTEAERARDEAERALALLEKQIEIQDVYADAVLPDGSEKQIRANADAMNLRFAGDLGDADRRAYEAQNGPADAFEVVYIDAAPGAERRVLPVKNLSPEAVDILAQNRHVLDYWAEGHRGFLKDIDSRLREAKSKAFDAKLQKNDPEEQRWAGLVTALNYWGLAYTDGGKSWRSLKYEDLKGTAWYYFAGRLYGVKANGESMRVMPGRTMLKDVDSYILEDFTANLGRVVPELVRARETAEREAAAGDPDAAFDKFKKSVDDYLKRNKYEERRRSALNGSKSVRLRALEAQLRQEYDRAYQFAMGPGAHPLVSKPAERAKYAAEKAVQTMEREKGFRERHIDVKYRNHAYEFDGRESKAETGFRFKNVWFLGDMTDEELAQHGASRIQGDPSKIRVRLPGADEKYVAVPEDTIVAGYKTDAGSSRLARVEIGTNNIPEFLRAMARRLVDRGNQAGLIAAWRDEQFAVASAPVLAAQRAREDAFAAYSKAEAEVNALRDQAQKDRSPGDSPIEISEGRKQRMANERKMYRAAIITAAQSAPVETNKLLGPQGMDEPVLVVREIFYTSPELISRTSRITGLTRDQIVRSLLRGEDPVSAAVRSLLLDMKMENGGQIQFFNDTYGEWYGDRLMSKHKRTVTTLKQLEKSRGEKGPSFTRKLQEEGSSVERYASITEDGGVEYGKVEHLLYGAFRPELGPVDEHALRNPPPIANYVLVDLRENAPRRFVGAWETLEKYREFARKQPGWGKATLNPKFDELEAPVPGWEDELVLVRRVGDVAADNDYLVVNYDPATTAVVRVESDASIKRQVEEERHEDLARRGIIPERALNRNRPPEERVEIRQNEEGGWEMHAPPAQAGDGLGRKNRITKVYDRKTGHNVMIGTQGLYSIHPPFVKMRAAANGNPLSGRAIMQAYLMERGIFDGYSARGSTLYKRMDSGEILTLNPHLAPIFYEYGSTTDLGRRHYLSQAGFEARTLEYSAEYAQQARELFWQISDPALLPPERLTEPRDAVPSWVAKVRLYDDAYFAEMSNRFDLSRLSKASDDARDAWVQSFLYSRLELRTNAERKAAMDDVLRASGILPRLDLAAVVAGPDKASGLFDRALDVYAATLKRSDAELSRWDSVIDQHRDALNYASKAARLMTEPRAKAWMMEIAALETRADLKDLGVPTDIVDVFTEDQSGIFDVLSDKNREDLEREADRILSWSLAREMRKSNPDKTRVDEITALIDEVRQASRETEALKELRARRQVSGVGTGRIYLIGPYSLETARYYLEMLEREAAQAGAGATKTRLEANIALLKAKLRSAEQDIVPVKARTELSRYDEDKLIFPGHVDYLNSEIKSNPERRAEMRERRDRALSMGMWIDQIDKGEHLLFGGYFPTRRERIEEDARTNQPAPDPKLIRGFLFKEEHAKPADKPAEPPQGSRIAGVEGEIEVDDQGYPILDYNAPAAASASDRAAVELRDRIQTLARRYPYIDFDDFYSLGEKAIRANDLAPALDAVRAVSNALDILNGIAENPAQSVALVHFGNGIARQRFFISANFGQGTLKIAAPSSVEPILAAFGDIESKLWKQLVVAWLKYEEIPAVQQNAWRRLSRGSYGAAPASLFKLYLAQALGFSVEMPANRSRLDVSLDAARREFMRRLIEEPEATQKKLFPGAEYPELVQLGMAAAPIGIAAVSLSLFFRRIDRVRARGLASGRPALRGGGDVEVFTTNPPRWIDELRRDFWRAVPQLPRRPASFPEVPDAFPAANREDELSARGIRLLASGFVSPGVATVAPMFSIWPILAGKQEISMSREVSGDATLVYLHVNGRHVVTLRDTAGRVEQAMNALTEVDRIYARSFVDSASADMPYRAEIWNAATEGKNAFTPIRKAAKEKTLSKWARALNASIMPAFWVVLPPLVVARTLLDYGYLDWVALAPMFAFFAAWKAAAGRDLLGWAAAWMPGKIIRSAPALLPAPAGAPDAPSIAGEKNAMEGSVSVAGARAVKALAPGFRAQLAAFVVMLAAAVPLGAQPKAFAMEDGGAVYEVRARSEGDGLVADVFQTDARGAFEQAAGSLAFDGASRAETVKNKRGADRAAQEAGAEQREKSLRADAASRDEALAVILPLAAGPADRVPPLELGFDLADLARGAADADSLRVKLEYLFADLARTAAWIEARGIPVTIAVKDSAPGSLDPFELSGFASRRLARLADEHAAVFVPSAPGEGRARANLVSDSSSVDAVSLNVGYADSPVGSYHTAAMLAIALSPLAAGHIDPNGAIRWGELDAASVPDEHVAVYRALSGKATNAGEVFGALSGRSRPFFDKLKLPVPSRLLSATMETLRAALRFISTAA